MNAGQAIGDAGEVRIATRATDECIIVEISDDGCGIEPELQVRIFEPFFTTKPVGTGTGLGLGIARQIVRKHGGSIEVESCPGRGSEFSVRLPVHADRMEPHSQS
jgi:signal transduction histidine kinase